MSIIDTYAADVGQRIRAARLAKGLTLRECAEQSDVSHSYLSEVENGISVPGARILQRLAATLKIKIGALLPG